MSDADSAPPHQRCGSFEPLREGTFRAIWLVPIIPGSFMAISDRSGATALDRSIAEVATTRIGVGSSTGCLVGEQQISSSVDSQAIWLRC
jgi:hypothetical protein